MGEDMTKTGIQNGHTTDPNGSIQKPKSSGSLKDEKVMRYGWFSFTPNFLQAMNTATVYAILMTLANIFQSGTTNGIVGSVQSSIERRFQLTSQQSSIIIVTYEVASIPISIFATWLGTVGCHRPRWSASAIVSGALGCFVYALPHFTTGVYMPGGAGGTTGDQYTCSLNRTDICDDDDGQESADDLVGYIGVFVLARVLLSYGGSLFYTLSITYLDDSLTKEKFSLWSSVFVSGGVIGPALGFIVGGLALSLFTDFITVDPEDIGLQPGDPLWVGAWWLPLILFGFFLLFFSIPMSGYPADLPGAAEIRANKKTEAFGVEKDEIPEDMTHFNVKSSDIVPFTKTLMTNWTFIFLTLYVCCDMSLLSAFTVYGPKYAELMFSLSAGEAGVLFGALVVPAGALGTIGAGLIIDRLKLSLYNIMRLEAAVSCLVVIMGPGLAMRCTQPDFIGIDAPYNSSWDADSGSITLNDTCNAHCNCEDIVYTPICSVESKQQYYSPCHAGCYGFVEDSGSRTLYNCSCIPTPDPTEPGANWSICPSPDCSLIPAFGVMIFIAMAGLFMSEAMNVSATIRSIPNKMRVYGMFLSGLIVRFLGTVPGPVIFASAFDSSCLVWQDTCGVQGSCFLYDTKRLSLLIMGISMSVKALSIVFMFCAFMLYKQPQVVEEEIGIGEEEVEGEAGENKAGAGVENIAGPGVENIAGAGVENIALEVEVTEL